MHLKDIMTPKVEVISCVVRRAQSPDVVSVWQTLFRTLGHCTWLQLPFCGMPHHKRLILCS